MIPSLLVLKCILERRCGVICPKPAQLKESLKTKLISNNLIFHLEISAPSPRGERFLWTGSISVDLTCHFRPSCSKRTFFFFFYRWDTEISWEALHSVVSGDSSLLMKLNLRTQVIAPAHKPLFLLFSPLDLLWPQTTSTGDEEVEHS